jgi:hypothetical protein
MSADLHGEWDCASLDAPFVISLSAMSAARCGEWWEIERHSAKIDDLPK